MAENTLKKINGKGSGTVQVEAVRGVNSTRLAIVIGLTIILSILAIGCVIAIYLDPLQQHNYLVVLLPVISGAISAGLGYLAGQRSHK